MPGGMFKWAAPLFALGDRRWSDDDASVFAEWLRPAVPRGGRLLDLGGGTGRLGELLAAALACSVTVLDSSPHMLRYASRRRTVTTVEGDASAMPFADASFDGVVSVDAFHHFRRQAEVAREVARVLRPGGAAVVAELDPGDRGVRWVAAGERLLREPAAFVAPDELAALFAAVGITGTSHRQGPASYVFVGAREARAGGRGSTVEAGHMPGRFDRDLDTQGG